jgi:hypothetical protein
MDTVRLFGLDAAPHILGVRDGLQVFRVHASPITAQMVHLKPVRDWTEAFFVDMPMRRSIATTFFPQL